MMTLEDVIGKVIHYECLSDILKYCVADNTPDKICTDEIEAKCHAEYIRKNWGKLK